ncbi:MAG TPA: apolipoprotein N-acyltransferase [Mariniphaga anaerophila]|uniref:Apolipoprotein N-acyltransferase n=1 Tax=Mariniphaga anaerophila TaxID=1484053 RepID=A0A831LNZ9_9BACT|nr:apolipoprotein N-acyltransferase [Mariniphaga anaerophila]
MLRIQRILLSALSGILLSLAWLGFPGWMLFFALLPLLYLDHFFVVRKQTFRSVSFWGHALLSFVIWNAITTWWIAYATFAGAILAIAANSFLMSVVWWLGHIARRRFHSSLGYLALAVFWISFEYFHFHWDIEWPWLNLGNGFANDVKMIQWYEFTGILGGTLWVLAVNFILFSILMKLNRKNSLKTLLYPASVLILLIVVPVAWSVITYYSYTEKEDPLQVVIVQPNIDPYNEDYDIQAESKKLQKFIQLADQKTDGQTNLVIGPETIFERYPDWNTDRLSTNFLFRQLTDWMWNYPGTEVIFGASTSKIYPDAESATSTSRVSNNIHYDVFNSAVFIDRNGIGEVYHKSILVSGVEKMPFRKYLGFLNDLVFDLGGTTGSLGKQAEPSNFTLQNGIKVAPVICYESVFGGYLTRFVHKEASLIVVITNDGWWRNTPGYKQHLSFSRLRAIETRRSVARSANTGISCFVNQRGDVLQPTAWWEEAAIKDTVNLNDELTFYVKHGDYIARVALFMSVLLLLFLVVKKFIKE